jgi:hypothetical protein
VIKQVMAACSGEEKACSEFLPDIQYFQINPGLPGKRCCRCKAHS